MTNAEAYKWLYVHFAPCGDETKQDAAVTKALEALKKQILQEWVPVDKKSHPDTPIRVQVQLANGWIITAYYEENEWFSVPYCDEPLEDRWIEAWRPLPEPYKAESEGEKRVT